MTKKFIRCNNKNGETKTIISVRFEAVDFILSLQSPVIFVKIISVQLHRRAPAEFSKTLSSST